jgi:uncharacterized protein YjbI with pentapeptide repeats
MTDLEEAKEAEKTEAVAEQRCATRMYNQQPCGRPIHPSPVMVDNAPVCLMHSRDLTKDDAEFQVEFERVLSQADTGIADFTGFVFGSVDYSGRTFHATCVFRMAVFACDVIFARVRFHNGADFTGARFEGQASFSEAFFAQEANYLRCVFVGKSSFWKTIFRGTTRFVEARIEGEAEFGLAQFDGMTLFDGAVFSRKVGFDSATFKLSPCFAKCKFESQASLKDSLFMGLADFTGVGFDGPADFTRARFVNTADFSGAQFRGDASFGGAIFQEYACLWHARFQALAHYIGAAFHGGANLCGAVFEKRADFSSADFNGSAGFIATEFREEADFCISHFSESAEFRHTRFRDDSTRLPGPRFFRADFDKPEAVVFYQTFLGQALFYNCDVSRFLFSDVEWCRRPGSLKRMVFEEVVELSEDDPLSPDVGGADERNYRLIAELYQQLKKNYDDRRDYWTAGDFHYGEMEMKRLATPQPNRLSRWLKNIGLAGPRFEVFRRRWHQHFGLPAWYKYASQYGESYNVPLLWIVGVVSLFMFLYPLLGLQPALRVAGGQAVARGSLSHDANVPELSYHNYIHYESLQPGGEKLSFAALLGHSLMTSVGVAALQRDLAYEPSYPWGRALSWLELALTSALIALFLLAVRRQFRR